MKNLAVNGGDMGVMSPEAATVKKMEIAKTLRADAAKLHHRRHVVGGEAEELALVVASLGEELVAGEVFLAAQGGGDGALGPGAWTDDALDMATCDVAFFENLLPELAEPPGCMERRVLEQLPKHPARV